MTSCTDWAIIVGAVAAVVQAIVVVSTAIFAARRLGAMSKARSVSVITDMFHRLSTREAREDRLFILEELPEWSEEAMKDPSILNPAFRVSGVLNNLAYLVDAELVPPEEIFGLFADIFIRCWRKLEPYIETRRRELGESGKAYKYSSFEKVTKEAERWYAGQYPEHGLLASRPQESNSPT